jgi:hypothetical protein
MTSNTRWRVFSLTPGALLMMRDTVDRETPAFAAMSSRLWGRLVKVVVGFTAATTFYMALIIFGSALKFSDIIIVGFSKVCQEGSLI